MPMVRWSPLLLCLLLAPAGLRAADEGESALKLGERFFRDSLYSLALEQYNRYLSLPHPPERDPEVQFRKAQCWHKLGAMREAAAGFDDYVRLFPGSDQSMDALYLAATAHAALGAYKDASDRYYKVWSRFTGNARAQSALYEAAVCAEKDNNAERAIELYQVYLQRFAEDERSKQATLALAGLLAGQKDYAAAQDLLAKGRKTWPGDKVFAARAQFRKAQMAVRLKRTQEAAAAFREMMDLAGKAELPEMEQALREYIDFLTMSQDYATSLKVFPRYEETVRKTGGRLSAERRLLWADNARMAKSYELAQSQYADLLKTRADSVDAGRCRYNIAECQIGRGDFAAAIETLQGLAMDDSAGEYGGRAVLKIGDLYYSRDLHVPAIAAYRRYLQLPRAKSADAIQFRIATIYQDKFAQYGSAARELEDLLKRYPATEYASRAMLRLAQCLEALGDLHAALRHYRYLVEAEGQEVGDAARERVQYLESYRIKDSDGAAAALAELVERRDSLPEYERRCRLARIYGALLKDYQRAIALYDSVAAMQPPAPDSVLAEVLYATAFAHEQLATKAALEKNGKTATHERDRAQQLYRQAIERYPGSRWSDDAAFRTMMLAGPGLEQYERFAADYPDSRHLPEVLLATGRQYEGRAVQDPDKGRRGALNAYRTVVSRFASDTCAPAALLGMARAYLALGQADSAGLAVEQLLARSTDVRWKAEARFVQGVVLRSRGANSAAVEAFREVLYQYPFSSSAGEARYELARAQLDAGEAFEALNNFRVYAQNRPDNPHQPALRLAVGRCLARLGRYEEAQAQLQELLDRAAPDSVRTAAYETLAQVAEKQGDVTRALECYRKVLDAGTGSGVSARYAHIGALYFENRMYQEAAQAYAQACERAGAGEDSMRCMQGRVTALLMAGEGKAADKLIAEFKERYGEPAGPLAEIVYHEGLALVQAREYEKAINRFKYVTTRFAGSERADDAAYQAALAHYYDGKKERAAELFTDFLSKYPSSQFVAYARFKLGMILHEREEYARAAGEFAAVAGDAAVDAKTRMRAANNAALDYQRVSGWLDAARMYRRVLEDFPGEVPLSTAHLKVGFCLVQASRFEEAIRHFEQASVNPTPDEKPELLYWLGMCHAKLGDFDRAISDLLKVPYLYAGVGKWGVTAELEAARLYERKGEYDRARSLYARIMRSDGENGQFGRAASERLKQLNNLPVEAP